MKVPPSIFADAESGPEVIIRVAGRGSFENSPALNEFVRRMIETGRRNFIVDLQDCPVMDSTFMGTLAAIAVRLESAGGGNLWVTNRNQRNADLLSDLGIDTLFSTQPAPVPVNGTASVPVYFEADKATTRETMHEAHKACVAANPANATKFKDVLEHLAASATRAASA